MSAGGSPNAGSRSTLLRANDRIAWGWTIRPSCVEHDTHRYVPASIMRPALEANGIKVVGDRIYVKEVKVPSPQRLRGVLRGHP